MFLQPIAGAVVIVTVATFAHPAFGPVELSVAVTVYIVVVGLTV